MSARSIANGALRQLRRPCAAQGRRYIRISATSTVESPTLKGDMLNNSIDGAMDSADARFEVLGAPYSLLSVSLSASQKLYTRRGTLVGVSGKSENAQSTLSVLEPFRRAFLGIPFLYQRITSTSPIEALISTKSPLTSFTVLKLDGTFDWMITQRTALLAWTGHRLSVFPRINQRMSLAHWGNTQVTGRGLVALSGPGQVYQITLKRGEEYVAHPGNVMAYTITPHPPLPYRFKSSTLQFQVPSVGLSAYLPDIKFFRSMQQTSTWLGAQKLFFELRTLARRTIWGDRLFLKFYGPTTILVSSRASRISDVMTSRDVDEIADSPAGLGSPAVTLETAKAESTVAKHNVAPTGFHVAEVRRDGSVSIEDVADPKSIVR